ncbi:MAG: ADP-ribosylglycohydrolase family protein [Bacilli bacterium]|nr:ADP-ribosylglycohydrolase family protein [Bacilli bacterium]
MSILKNSLIGFVIGDAMGVPIEFEERETLKSYPLTEMVGYGSYDEPAGTWSDDTSMTLATIDSIIEKKTIDYYDIATKFCEWVNNAKYTATNHIFDIGITTKYALVRFFVDKIEPTKCGGVLDSENGNGSLMRIMPIALYAYYNKLDDNLIFDIVKNTSSITHANDQSILGCYIYVKYLLKLIETNDLLISYEYIKSLDYNKYFSNEIINLYQRILKNDIYKYPLEEIKSSGYIIHTLEAVLWVVLNTKKFKESIVSAINLGEDTDTVGAIVGSITGIKYGFDSMPTEWISKIQNLNYIYSLIEKWDQIYN